MQDYLPISALEGLVGRPETQSFSVATGLMISTENVAASNELVFVYLRCGRRL
jgi:hypothetical protein